MRCDAKALTLCNLGENHIIFCKKSGVDLNQVALPDSSDATHNLSFSAARVYLVAACNWSGPFSSLVAVHQWREAGPFPTLCSLPCDVVQLN